MKKEEQIVVCAACGQLPAFPKDKTNPWICISCQQIADEKPTMKTTEKTRKMKSAEEWVMELDANETGVAICTASEIQQIQLDAHNAAVREAAEKANEFADYDSSRDGRVIGNAILTLLKT